MENDHPQKPESLKQIEAHHNWHLTKFRIALIAVLILIPILIFALWAKLLIYSTPEPTQTVIPTVSVPTPTLTPTPISDTSSSSALFNSIAGLINKQIATGSVTIERTTFLTATGPVTSNAQMIEGKATFGNNGTTIANNFIDKKELEALGWQEDINQAADGPASSQWGYKMSVGTNMVQLLTLQYRNVSLKPSADGPLTATCPCTYTFTVLMSEPITITKK